jgi:hypothetical protein
MSVMITTRSASSFGLRFAPDRSSDSLYAAGAKSKQVGAKQKPRNRWIVLGALLLLSSYWLWCHGCHGDEDNELFSRAAGYRDGRMETCRQLTTHQAPPTVNEVVIANILR